MELPTVHKLADPVLTSVLHRVRLHACRRVEWLKWCWSKISQNGSDGNSLNLELEGYFYNQDTPEAELNWYQTEKGLQAINAEIAAIDAALQADKDSRLAHVRRSFGLEPGEMDYLHLCLALSIEPNLGQVYAYLQDNSGRPQVTEALTARLFGHGYCLPLAPESPLLAWSLILERRAAQAEPAYFELDASLRNFLLNLDGLDEHLLGIAQYAPVYEPLAHWPFAANSNWLKQMEASPLACRISIVGAPGSGRRSLAAALVAQWELPLLVVNATQVSESLWPKVYLHAQRHALLNNCALAWLGPFGPDRHWPTQLASSPWQFAILETDEYLPAQPGFLDHRVEIPALTKAQRLDYWKKWVPAAQHWAPAELEQLAQRRQTTIGQIAAAAAQQVQSPAEAAALISAANRQRLHGLAQVLPSGFTWDDLIISAPLRELLADFAFQAAERVLFWEQPAAQRLFPLGRGLMALFTGPPGTGKTMAAQVIANELGQDLFRVDLSNVVSKYVGETSKNIERILSRARDMDAILFFDEADALFSRRTEVKDAHDRFANTDSNYLLQAIEQFPGIAILATNFKSNIDPGFLRRLPYLCEFAKPDAALRLLLWSQVIAELFSAEQSAALQPDLNLLAQHLELTGAQIKNTVLAAAFMARKPVPGAAPAPISLKLPLLLRCLERELQKEGRGLGRQLQDLLKTSNGLQTTLP